ncbi:hypothetical protein HZS_5614, partial [Henneguya salminicola]
MIQVFRYLSGFRNIECKQFEEKICKIAGLNEYLLELMIERSKNPKGLTEEELQFLSFAYTNIVDGLELKYRKLSETIRSIPDTNIRHEICQLLREKLRSKIKNEWLRMDTIICVQLFHARKDTLTQLYLLKLRADSCVYVCKSAVAARRTDLYNLTLNFYNQALLVARSESDNHPLSNELRENIKEFKDYIESQPVQENITLTRTVLEFCYLAELDEYLLEAIIERSENSTLFQDEELNFLSLIYQRFFDNLILSYIRLTHGIKWKNDEDYAYEIYQLQREKIREKINREWSRLDKIICSQFSCHMFDTDRQLRLVKLRAESSENVYKTALGRKRKELRDITLAFYEQAELAACPKKGIHMLSDELRKNKQEFNQFLKNEQENFEMNTAFISLGSCEEKRKRLERKKKELSKKMEIMEEFNISLNLNQTADHRKTRSLDWEKRLFFELQRIWSAQNEVMPFVSKSSDLVFLHAHYCGLASR